MIFSNEVMTLVSRYFIDKYGFNSSDEIDVRNWSHVVGLYWDALAYYKKDNWYYSLSDVNEIREGMHVSIRLVSEVNQYRQHRGEWIPTGTLYESMYS